jgi:hypothetical protein
MTLADFDRMAEQTLGDVLRAHGFSPGEAYVRGGGTMLCKPFSKPGLRVDALYDNREEISQIKFITSRDPPDAIGQDLIRALVKRKRPVGLVFHGAQGDAQQVFREYGELLRTQASELLDCDIET